MNNPKKEMVYTIYQANDTKEGREILFMNFDRCKRLSLKPCLDNYNEVYSGILPEGKGLDDLYYKFNMAHPKDFHGHSLSVSDVIVLNQPGVTKSNGKAYFVDSIGFQELPDFFPEKRILYVKDAKLSFKKDGSVSCKCANEDFERPFKSRIQDIRDGDAFLSHGNIYVAGEYAHINLDEKDNPWIVYDKEGAGWFEEDIDSIFPSGEEISWVPDSMKNGFIFDEELMIEDVNYEAVDGYLWATDFLVGKLTKQIEDNFKPETLNSMDNINFYPIWNQAYGTIDVLSCYSIENYKGEEVRVNTYLTLSENEKAYLCALMNHYCFEQYGQSCFEFVNQERENHGFEKIQDPSTFLSVGYAFEKGLLPKALEKLPDLSEKNPSLDEMVSVAEKRQISASQSIKTDKSEIDYDR